MILCYLDLERKLQNVESCIRKSKMALTKNKKIEILENIFGSKAEVSGNQFFIHSIQAVPKIPLLCKSYIEKHSIEDEKEKIKQLKCVWSELTHCGKEEDWEKLQGILMLSTMDWKKLLECVQGFVRLMDSGSGKTGLACFMYLYGLGVKIINKEVKLA